MPRYEYIANFDGKQFTRNTLKLLKTMLENANLGPRKLAEEVGVSHPTITYMIKEKIEPLGGKYVYFIHPKKLGFSTALVRVKPDPQKLEDAAAYLTLSPLVRMVGLNPNRDELWLFIVGEDWRIQQFKHRLRTTPAVRDYEIIPLDVRKFEQPIPPELLEDMIKGAQEE
ncbi:MAG: Lrp/AsnC family transcriptional regulator [Candidatus Diapherotrites archaeon]|nr:Lrp/AsnC family transcriptional regulator [Candidatus Diapherotrites archaeon]